MRKNYAAVAVILFISLLTVDAQSIESHCKDNNVSIGILPHPQPDFCDQYVICVLYNSIVQQCPPERVFVSVPGSNPPDGACQPGNPDTCEVFTPEPTTTTSTTTTTTTTTTTQPPPITSPTTTYTTTSSPGIPSELCNGITFRRIPYPGNCYQYIFCILQVPHLGQCADRQIFHPDWNICIRGDRNTCQFCLLC